MTDADDKTPPTYLRLFHMLRHGVVASLVLGLLGGLLLPLYTDEVGWRLQERAWIDGIDKLYSDQCGPNTLTMPPFFMWPVRWYSGFFNLHFAQPYWVRISGVLYACLWLYLLLALIRRIARNRTERHMIAIIACTLIGLGCTPLLLVWSRPEQPIMLALTLTLLIASNAWQAPGNRFAPFTGIAYSTASTAPEIAWLRSLSIAALAMIALSYHFKALITMPVFAAAILMASRGPRALLPRAAALALLVAAALAAMHYWSARLACPLDPLINREFNRQNLGAQIANNATAGSGGLFNLVWSVLSNLRFDAYIDAAAPQVFPMSRWLVAGRVSADEMQGWRGGMTVIWALAGAAGLTAALAALWQQGRRKVLACDAAMALILLGVAAMWCASQFVRHDYEVSFELPLLILAIVMGLASPHGLDRLKRALPVLAMALGPLMILSLVLVAGLYGPPMVDALGSPAYLPQQPYSVPLLARERSNADILGAAGRCGLSPARPARNLLIDDVTYFTFMGSHTPQHYLGVLPLRTRGSIEDPLLYLDKRHSSGIVMGCHKLPEELRDRARRQGSFCCLAPPDW
ncbi:hypothetical protein [Novosphingobium sp.]|uniref:hypothetical protein n=1 Tax=Novosphingobium sp. TaxID=1874826 RepID=UPI0031D57021